MPPHIFILDERTRNNYMQGLVLTNCFKIAEFSPILRDLVKGVSPLLFLFPQRYGQTKLVPK